MAEKPVDTLGAAKAEVTGGGSDIGTNDMMRDFVRELVTGAEAEGKEKEAVAGEPDAGDKKEEQTKPPEAGKPDAEPTSPEPEKEAEEEEIPEPENITKAAKENWNKLRDAKIKHEKRAADLSKQVAKLGDELKNAKTETDEVKQLRATAEQFEQVKGKIALLPEMEERVKNYEEMEKLVAILRVEESPEYRRAVGDPLDAIGAAAEALAKANEISVSELFAALGEPDMVTQMVKLKEVTAGLDDFERGTIRKMAEDTRMLLNRQAEMRAKASEAAKEQQKLASEASEQAKKQSRGEFHKAADSAMSQLKESIPFIPLREGETHEDRIAAITEKVKSVDFENSPPQNKAFSAAAAIYLPTVLKMLKTVQDEVEILKKRVKTKGDKEPTIKDTPAAPHEAADDDDFLKAMGMPGNPSIIKSLKG